MIVTIIRTDNCNPCDTCGKAIDRQLLRIEPETKFERHFIEAFLNGSLTVYDGMPDTAIVIASEARNNLSDKETS